MHLLYHHVGHSSSTPPPHHLQTTSESLSHSGADSTTMMMTTVSTTLSSGPEKAELLVLGLVMAFIMVFFLARRFKGPKSVLEGHQVQMEEGIPAETVPIPGPDGSCPMKLPSSCHPFLYEVLLLLQVLLFCLLLLTVMMYRSFFTLSVTLVTALLYWLFDKKKAKVVDSPPMDTEMVRP